MTDELAARHSQLKECLMELVGHMRRWRGFVSVLEEGKNEEAGHIARCLDDLQEIMLRPTGFHGRALLEMDIDGPAGRLMGTPPFVTCDGQMQVVFLPYSRDSVHKFIQATIGTYETVISQLSMLEPDSDDRVIARSSNHSMDLPQHSNTVEV
jgi:hypothetical protein